MYIYIYIYRYKYTFLYIYYIISQGAVISTAVGAPDGKKTDLVLTAAHVVADAYYHHYYYYY